MDAIGLDEVWMWTRKVGERARGRKARSTLRKKGVAAWRTDQLMHDSAFAPHSHRSHASEDFEAFTEMFLLTYIT